MTKTLITKIPIDLKIRLVFKAVIPTMEFARPRKPTCQQVIKRDKPIVIDLRLKQRHPTDILIKKKVFDQNVCLLTNLN